MTINIKDYFPDYDTLFTKIRELDTCAQPKPSRNPNELQLLKAKFDELSAMNLRYQEQLIKAPYTFAKTYPQLIHQYAPALEQEAARHQTAFTTATDVLNRTKPILQANNIPCSQYLLPPPPPPPPGPSLLSRVGTAAQRNINLVGNICLIATAAIGLQYATGKVFPIVACTACAYLIERAILSRRTK